MKCGRCNTTMKEEEGVLFGERIRVYNCPKCGNGLVSIKEAIKVQERLLPRIETTRKLVKFGHSIAVTLPKELRFVFKKGEPVKVSFDPKDMELIIKKR